MLYKIPHMKESWLTAGQFAKLASTTKRTVTWYDKEGILKPHFIGQSGYRYYKPEQIIDFQVILLLRHLNFSIAQIKEFLLKNTTFKELFHLKRKAVIREIDKLTRSLKIIDSYYENFEKEGVLVKPTIKNAGGFEFYYLQKEGPYSKIYRYGLELGTYFKKLPRTAIFVTIYEEAGYKPVKSKFKVGVLVNEKMELKKETLGIVQKSSIPSFRALAYTHTGSPSLLSFHWNQLERYASKKKLIKDLTHPFIDIELYKRNGFVKSLEDDQVVTEMYMPIK